MRHGSRVSCHLSVAVIVAGLFVVGTAWATPGTVLSNQKISDTAGNFTPVMRNLDELAGATAYLGDLDGAGPSVSAMAIGASVDDDGGFDRGAVYITFLAANGTVLSSKKISDIVNFPGSPLDDADEFGSSIAFLGDLDGAGPSVGAIAVGAIGDDDGGIGPGAVYILFLAADGTVLSWQKISDTVNFPGSPLDALDEFGGSVANLGDLDGAGPSTSAIAVGSILDDDGGTDRGAVYILFLDPAGTVLSWQKISDLVNFPGTPLDNSDNFGGSVASLGDLDGAGPSVLALAAGSQLDDDGGTDRGAVYILFLNTAGTVLSVQKISDLVGNFNDVLGSGDEFGNALANLGDIDGASGGVTALAVGVPGSDDAGLDRGAVQVLFLNSNGTCNSSQKISSLAGNFLTPLDDEDGFGSSLASLGDLDAAGPSTVTLAVGATGDDDGGTDRGAAYVLFLGETRALTVNVVGGGTVTRLPNQPAFTDGTSAQLTANPGTGWAFSAWSGGLVSTSNPASVVMNADKTVTCTFLDVASPTAAVTAPNGAEVVYVGTSTNITWTAADNAGVTAIDLALSRAGVGGPYVSLAAGLANSGTYSWLPTLPATTHAIIRVTAHDAAGHTTQDVSNAEFRIAPVQRTLTVNVVGTGTVTKLPDLTTYDDGSSVQLTANAGVGWAFSAWSGSLVSTSNPANVVMNGDKTVTCTFLDVASPTAAVTAPNGGEVLTSGTNTNITWTAADNVAVTAIDLELSRAGVGGPYVSIATGLANSGTFNWGVTLPATTQAFVRVTAHDAAGQTTQDVSNAAFTIVPPVQRTLTVNVVGGGTVTKLPDQATYDDSSSVQLTASPGTGWTFSAWSGGLVSTSNPASLVMDADKTVTCTFLDVASPTATVTVPNGAEVLISGTNTNITWTAADNAAVTAVDLELSRAGVGGPYESIATGLTNSGTFSWLPTLPATTQAFVRVTAHDAAGHTTQDVSNAAFTIVAPVQRTLTVNVVGAGTVTKLPNLTTYDNDSSVQLTANADPGWAFSAWGGGLVSTSNPANVVMNGDKTVTCTFLDVAPPTAAVTAPNGAEVLTSGTNASITWTAADNVAVTTIDLELSRAGVAGPYETIATGLANSGTFSWAVTLPATTQALIRVTAHDAAGYATQDLSNAEFTILPPAQRTLTVNVIGGGTVSKLPSQTTYTDGSSVQLTATSGTGWAFSAWSGGLVSTSNPASLVMDANKTVTCTFLDVVPPFVVLTAPNGADVMYAGFNSDIKWTALDNAGVTAIDLEVSHSGVAGPYEAVATGIANTGKYTWLPTLPFTTHAVVRVTAHDAAGHTIQDLSNAEFSIADGTGVDDGPVTAYALSPVWPNPVRGSTRFQFALPHDANVHLSVLDVQGRELLVLADGQFPAGRHSVDWSSTEGSGLDAGLYFIRMAVPGRNIARRFVLRR